MSFWDVLIRRLYFALVVRPPAFTPDGHGTEAFWRVLTAARFHGMLDVKALAGLSVRILVAVCPPGLLLRAEAERELTSRGLAAPPAPAALAGLAAPVPVALQAMDPFVFPFPAPQMAVLVPALMGVLSRVQGLFNADDPTGPAAVAWSFPELLYRCRSYAGPGGRFLPFLFELLVAVNLRNPPPMPPWLPGAAPPWFAPPTSPGGVLADEAEVAFLECAYRVLNAEERMAVLLAVHGGLNVSHIAPLLHGRVPWAAALPGVPGGAERTTTAALLTLFVRVFRCMAAPLHRV